MSVRTLAKVVSDSSNRACAGSFMMRQPRLSVVCSSSASRPSPTEPVSSAACIWSGSLVTWCMTRPAIAAPPARNASLRFVAASSSRPRPVGAGSTGVARSGLGG
ncbi:MAG TPA: hypothetical protein VIS06_02915, partial [Mycobacteriales bacterium]